LDLLQLVADRYLFAAYDPLVNERRKYVTAALFPAERE